MSSSCKQFNRLPLDGEYCALPNWWSTVVVGIKIPAHSVGSDHWSGYLGIKGLYSLFGLNWDPAKYKPLTRDEAIQLLVEFQRRAL